jgi:hypothetical protein
MAARNLLRETWRYLISLYNVTSGDYILLIAAAVSSLLIDPNIPKDLRTILAISSSASLVSDHIPPLASS